MSLQYSLKIIIGKQHCVQIAREYQRTIDRQTVNLIPTNSNTSTPLITGTCLAVLKALLQRQCVHSSSNILHLVAINYSSGCGTSATVLGQRTSISNRRLIPRNDSYSWGL